MLVPVHLTLVIRNDKSIQSIATFLVLFAEAAVKTCLAEDTFTRETISTRWLPTLDRMPPRLALQEKTFPRRTFDRYVLMFSSLLVLTPYHI
jgi:hypothetical protein